MLELLGRGYVIEHCVSVTNNTRKEEIYRMYVTESLRIISSGVGREITVKYTDIIERCTSRGKAEETRTPEEIIDNIRKKLRGEVTV